MIMHTLKRFVKAICPPILLGSLVAFVAIFRRKVQDSNLIVYAPAGFSTPLPPENNSWESDGVRSAHEKKWAAFIEAAISSEPFGFIYESENFVNRWNVTEHNLNMTFAYVLSRTALEKTLSNGALQNESLRVLDWGGGLLITSN